MKEVFRTELITEYMKEKSLSKTKFCKTCKISMISLNKVLSNDFDIGIKVVFKICKLISVPICNFFKHI